MCGSLLEMSNKLNLISGGVVSPSRNPHGFKPSTWSKMSLIIAVSGMDKNIPGTPHKAAPIITAIKQTKALSLTFDPIILGTM